MTLPNYFPPTIHQACNDLLSVTIQIFLLTSSLTHELFRNVMFHFQNLCFFLMYMLSVSSLSPFWLENILSMISFLSDLLSFGYLLSYGLEWKSTNLLFKGPDRKFFRLCAPCDLCHNHSVLLS